MKVFLFKVGKNLLAYWAARLLTPEAVTDVLLTVAKAHAKNTKTTTDDKLVEVVERYLNQNK
ncbi:MULTISPECIES: hypothetical protein [unclassified Vibrio]|uniref:hypothetical protein n=1 Tax=unclassified Vibrio TaxID=2614977 RepID=UPI0013737CD6|nr:MULTISPECIES: hypothetical protein [unclassified Vibrio]NAW78334.1 hypothetical protein [Vibrio sp. V33_P6A3T137]NAX01887.1 hypothetical protein [Vibrio sp. V34_P3A8T189]NAX08234.1 hypothetical protein [Vibrio sp. V40_P2S30T141]